MKQALILLLCVLCCVSVVQGFIATTIGVNNETLEITPLLQSCESTNKVFRIERLNYTVQSQTLLLKYIFWQDNRTKNMQKEINKYTASDTGEFLGSNNTQKIGFLFENQSYEWDVQELCENTANNITIETNKTTNMPEQIKEEVQEENEQCPEHFFLETNKNILKKGEQLSFWFSFSSEVSEQEITYWIEDNEGKSIKKPFTTSNTNTKTYTLSESITPGSYLHIKAKATTPCKDFTQEKIVGVEKSKQKEVIVLDVEEHKQGAKTHVEITDASGGKYLVLVETFSGEILAKQELILSEGASFQATLPLFFESSEDYLLAAIETKNQRQESYFKKEQKQTTQKQVQDAQIISSYSRQTKYSDELKWYVRTKGTPPYNITVQLGTEIKSTNITEEKEQTTSFLFYNHTENNTINTQLVQNNNTITVTQELLLEREQSFAQTLAAAQAQKEQVLFNTSIQAKVTQQVPKPKNKIVLLGLVCSLIVVLGLWEIRKKYLIKEGTFIKR